MQIGIMSRTFERPTLEETLDAIQAQGITSLQFSMSCAGLPSMPDHIPPEVSDRIRQALSERGMTMAANSGTFNMIHPDEDQRQAGLRRLEVLAAAAKRLDSAIITLCTGTRDPDHMWRRHPDNDSAAAWRDLATSMTTALEIAEKHDVTLVVEPEVANVIDSAIKARRLLDEMQSPHLKICIDGANIFHEGELPRMRDMLDEAFELLGYDIALAHAKDLSQDGAAGQEAAGTGLLDYGYYLTLLDAVGYDGPLILHSLTEAQTPGCVAFLQEKLGKLS